MSDIIIFTKLGGIDPIILIPVESPLAGESAADYLDRLESRARECGSIPVTHSRVYAGGSSVLPANRNHRDVWRWNPASAVIEDRMP